MARKVVVTVVDDYDGSSPAHETVTFGIDGIAYEIDLSTANAATLRELYGRWIPHARRTGRAARAKTGGSPTKSNRAEMAAIRSWARNNGYQLSDRGRIPVDVVTACRAAATPS
ncbi:Lsr2 family protein [Nocardia sp. NPDC057227]|uniref:histone-like nucleoid-structuring protein Lsr2 n=1 Tax=Nocardia sp. NPDC057227 TaxID=3346056 RepID=UPI00363B2D33